MKTNYTTIKRALARLDEARVELNKIANLRIGVIFGGPDIHDERNEFDSARLALERLVRQAISNNCRLSYLLGILDGEITVTPLVKSAIEDRDNDREWKRENNWPPNW